MFFKILLLLLLLPCSLQAQTIDVELPYYADREYYFCLLQGTRQDTIATGVLDAKGKATIDFPQDYRGVGRLTIREYGRLRNVILNGEKHIRLIEADSLEARTKFAHSPENSFLVEAMAKQNRIINMYNSRTGNPLTPFLTPAQEYKTFREEISKSPLYAARVFEILNLLSGIGSSFDISQDKMLAEQRIFITQKLDFNDLYTSGFWQLTFDLWSQITQGDDSLLIEDARTMLERTNTVLLRRELAQTIIRLFSKYGKDNLLPQIGSKYFTMPLNGQLAPEIKVGETSFLPKSSLIIFYETGCGNCHYELHKLIDKYKTLTDNYIRVISIAADMDKNVFEETAAKLPWADKLCDFKGFDGDNFKNYGIVGTPTYILTDKEGIVRGRYAQLKELIKE